MNFFQKDETIPPVSTSATANYGNGVALSSNLGGDGADDGTNQATEDVAGSSRSSFVYRSAALDGTAAAATVDGGRRRGGEGSSNKESDFGEHRK